MRLPELKTLARSLGIEVDPKARKADLVNAIREVQGPAKRGRPPKTRDSEQKDTADEQPARQEAHVTESVPEKAAPVRSSSKAKEVEEKPAVSHKEPDAPSEEKKQMRPEEHCASDRSGRERPKEDVRPRRRPARKSA